MESAEFLSGSRKKGLLAALSIDAPLVETLAPLAQAQEGVKPQRKQQDQTSVTRLCFKSQTRAGICGFF